MKVLLARSVTSSGVRYTSPDRQDIATDLRLATSGNSRLSWSSIGVEVRRFSWGSTGLETRDDSERGGSGVGDDGVECKNCDPDGPESSR